MALVSLLKSVFAPESWCCAIRFNNGDKSLLDGNNDAFVVVPNSKRYWLADPFIVCENKKYYLFFEAFDRLQKKGVLGYREVSSRGFGEIKIIHEEKTHLSFPFIYKENDTYYIIPESEKQGELFRLKCASFPDKWEKECVLLNNNVVDTVFLKQDDKRFYITELIESDGVFDRVDLFYEENGRLKPFSNNPVKRDADNARGAGRIFRHNDRLIRPAQNCGKSYGEMLNFNEITSLEINMLEEKQIMSVCVNDINLNVKNNFVGIHTYNCVGNVEVIDLKNKRRFNFYNFIGALVKLFTKVVKV